MEFRQNPSGRPPPPENKPFTLQAAPMPVYASSKRPRAAVDDTVRDDSGNVVSDDAQFFKNFDFDTFEFHKHFNK